MKLLDPTAPESGLATCIFLPLQQTIYGHAEDISRNLFLLAG
jgi:hypothetical protein